MDKFFKTGSYIALVISIITCMSIGDDVNVTTGDMLLALLIITLGVFIYAQYLYFNEKIEKKSE